MGTLANSEDPDKMPQNKCKLNTNLVCYIIDYNNTMSTSVITGCYSSKSFLTSCVPLKIQEHKTCQVAAHRSSGSAVTEFILFDLITSHQQYFSYIGTDLPGLNQY